MNGAESALRHASRVNGTAQMMSRRYAFKSYRTEHPNELYTSSHLLLMLINRLPRYLDVPQCMRAYASLDAQAWKHEGPLVFQALHSNTLKQASIRKATLCLFQVGQG